MSYRTHRRKARQKPTRTKNLPLILALAGALLLLSSLGFRLWSEGRTDLSGVTYDPADVIVDQPFLAVHEMGDGPPILFYPEDQAQPKILIPQTSHDFGRIGARDVVEHAFIIRNTGRAPLTISRAYTTCGCTTAQISARVIPPGKAATINLIFDAGFHDAAGQTVRRGLILENNDPRQPQAEIWIQAAVRES